MGTDTVRPSSRSTESVSSVTTTFETLANVTSTEFIPFISQQLHLATYGALNVAQFLTTVAAICDQRCVRIQPELCAEILAVNMHMSRLRTIVRIKIQAVRSGS